MSASSASGRTLGDALSILAPPTSSGDNSGGSSEKKKRKQPDEPCEVIAELLPVVFNKKRKFVGVSAVDRFAHSTADTTQEQEEAVEGIDSSGKEKANQAGKEKETEGKKITQLVKGDSTENVASSKVTSKMLDSRMRAHLKARLERLKEDNQRVLDKRHEALARHRDFLGLYEYSLDRISRLNDLRDAPDAILPGNFPDSY